MASLQQLEERLCAVRANRDLDERRVFARVLDEGETVRLEVSDAPALQLFAAALQEATPKAVRAVQLPNADLRESVAWVTASVADVRRHPGHAAEQITQALQGEVLEPLLHEDGWVLVRMFDDYVGWVRDWHVQLRDGARREQVAHAERVDARLSVPWQRLYLEPAESAPAVAESLLGTRVVRMRQRNTWIEIEIPGGRRGWVPQSAVRDGIGDWPCGARSILDMTRLFMGAPYVWGGRSPKGFDCSGLVQFVFGLHGVQLPRDSDQQFEEGAAVDELVAGDLLFFGRDTIGHVGVAIDAHDYLHARGEVRHNSLDSGSTLYDAELAALYRGGRRVLPQDR